MPKLRDLPPEVLRQISHLLRNPGSNSGDGIDPDAELPEPTGWNVLCLQYVRGDTMQTPGGMTLHLPNQTRKEDQYQGRCGIVVALGQDAYKDEAKYPRGPWVQFGDIVAWPALENASGRYSFAGGTLAVVPDDRLTLKGVDLARMTGR